MTPEGAVESFTKIAEVDTAMTPIINAKYGLTLGVFIYFVLLYKPLIMLKWYTMSSEISYHFQGFFKILTQLLILLYE